ncbi:MAG: EAL domain-containing protein, partial [Acholeplasmatales bacterium]|nr:EAL domain-containing protein [Acholeplasmatales bacterium]
ILSIEIIEKGYQDQFKNINNNINNLRDAGVGVILDDYGVGYSNIESIIDLNLSGIKFDHNLFASLKKETTKIVISHEIKSIRTLKRNIIIEGIENEDDLKFIQDLEINYIQGYHFSDALEYNDFIKFIQENEYQN